MADVRRDVLDVGRAFARLDRAAPRREAGRVVEVTGLVVRATVPGIRVGELCEIDRPGADPAARIEAEVVGFRGDEAVLMPLGELAGIGPDALVTTTGRPLTVGVAPSLLGRVLDGLGRPADGLGPVEGAGPWAVDRSAPDPLTRTRVTRPLPLGVRAMDALLTAGEGQRLGLFAGSGVGKSTLLGQIARQTEADVNVIALVGERGREVGEFLDASLGPAGRARSVVVCATSDAPSLVRLRSAFVATAIAEWFRAQGLRVLFMLDSLTRVARAQREVGLAAGEPPARQGYPPSVFAMLPRLLERAGTSDVGSITGLYTVLVEGDDMNDPVADAVRGILDGHCVLTRALAHRSHYPAIDVLQSVSRLAGEVAAPEVRQAAAAMRELMALHREKEDLISIGAYSSGSDERIDLAIRLMPAIEGFLRQPVGEHSPAALTDAEMVELVASASSGALVQA
jgi:type III secretion protein N (ATPase)